MNIRRGLERLGIVATVLWLIGAAITFYSLGWPNHFYPPSGVELVDIKMPNGSVIKNTPAGLSRLEIENRIRDKNKPYLLIARPVTPKANGPDRLIDPFDTPDFDWYRDFGPHPLNQTERRQHVYQSAAWMVVPVLAAWILFYTLVWAVSGFKSERT